MIIAALAGFLQTASGDELATTEDPVLASELTEGQRIFGHAVYLRDNARTMDLGEVLASDAWRPVTTAQRNLGISGAKIWVALSLINDTDLDQTIIVAHDIANLDVFNVAVVSPNGETESFDFPSNARFADRPVAFAAPAAKVRVPPGNDRLVIVSFGQSFPIPLHVGLRMWTEDGFEHHKARYLAQSVFMSTCLLMAALFWLLYGAIMRQARMLAYTVYLAALAYLVACFTGVGFQLLYPEYPWIQHLGYHWPMFLAIGAAFAFARRHLEMARNHPRHDFALRILTGASLVLTLSAIVVPRPALEAPVSFLLVTLGPIYIGFLSWLAWREDGLSYAKWMVAGWVPIGIAALLSTFGSLLNEPLTSLTQMDYTHLTFGFTVLESLFLSVSLAQWLRVKDRSRLTAERDAASDSLTGLLNRRGLAAQFAAVVQTPDWPDRYWIGVIDIDRFKQINDTYTHAAGDAVLRSLADLLVDGFGATGTVARYGGEEFVILLAASSEHEAVTAVERCRTQFGQSPTVFQDTAISHTFSAGIVPVAGWTSDVDEAGLIAEADKALYSAKRAGRDRVHVGGSVRNESAPS